MGNVRAVLVIPGLILLNATFAQNPDFSIRTSQGTCSAEKFSSYYFHSFDLETAQTLSLFSRIEINTVEISPKSDSIPFNQPDSRTLNFKITSPGYYLLRINDSVKVFVFAEKRSGESSNGLINIVSEYNVDPTGLINETEKIQRALDEIPGSGGTLYFPPGKYVSGQLQIRSNSKIYFARGAVLISDTSSVKPYLPTDDITNRRFIYLNGVENVEISGAGTIDGNGNYLRNRYGDEARIRLILAVKSKDVTIEGLTLKDPGSWNTQLIKCENMVLRDLKLLNEIDLSNTDGFDPDASRNVLIENCFAYCGDDNVAVKVTGSSDLSGEVDNIIVRGCVFLTKKSALKVGTETRTTIMKNITFEDNDILESDRGMAIYVRDGAILDNIKYINNRFERNHPDAQRKSIHFVVDKRNQDSKLGAIKSVIIKDCTFENVFPNRSVIEYEGEGKGINVLVENLIISGKKADTSDSARIEIINSTVTFSK